MQIEQLDQEEYCHLLSYGDPIDEPGRSNLTQSCDGYCNGMDDELSSVNSNSPSWISTLASTTYPGMTFGYTDAPYMYTSL